MAALAPILTPWSHMNQTNVTSFFFLPKRYIQKRWQQSNYLKIQVKHLFAYYNTNTVPVFITRAEQIQPWYLFLVCLSRKDIKVTAAAATFIVQASQVHLAVNRSQLAVLITLCKSTQVLEVLTVVTLRSRPSPTDPYHSLSVPGV